MERTSRLSQRLDGTAAEPADTPTSGEVYVGISVVADRLGLSLRTIRFYEEVGLITPRRTLGAARLFSSTDIRRLHLASDLRKAQFNLDQVRQILGILDEGEGARPRMATLQAILVEHQATLARQRIEVEQAQAYVAAFRARLEEGQEPCRLLGDGIEGAARKS